MRTPSNITKGHRVLIGTPTSDHKNYCLEDFIARIKSFSYKHYDILIVDNSSNRHNYKRFINEGFKVIYVKPKDKSIQNVLAESHEAIREYAVKHKYSYLLHLESDIIPPTDVIERLMIHNLPIVSAMYMINFGDESHLMAQKIEDFGELRETINMKEGADLMMINGKLKEVFAHGLGCCLIHKNVLTQFKFRWEKNVSLAPDSYWSLDIDALGINKYIDSSVYCQHYNSAWIYT